MLCSLLSGQGSRFDVKFNGLCPVLWWTPLCSTGRGDVLGFAISGLRHLFDWSSTTAAVIVSVDFSALPPWARCWVAAPPGEWLRSWTAVRPGMLNGFLWELRDLPYQQSGRPGSSDCRLLRSSDLSTWKHASALCLVGKYIWRFSRAADCETDRMFWAHFWSQADPVLEYLWVTFLVAPFPSALRQTNAEYKVKWTRIKTQVCQHILILY